MSPISFESAIVHLADVLQASPPTDGHLAKAILSHGSLEVEFYEPREIDPQRPHPRDEIYVIARGTADFFDGDSTRKVEAGALIFVAAGRVHRFEDMSDDFATWVLFYGPDGGEQNHG